MAKKIRADRVRWLGEAKSHDEAIARLERAGDAAVVVRGRARLVVMQCPCGCGDPLPINLDPRSGPAWRLYRRHGKASLYPSVDRENGCRSHFVLWNDRIWMGDVGSGRHTDGGVLTNVVLDWLAANGPSRYNELAYATDEIPWDVLRVCHRLVREGKLVEFELNSFAIASAPHGKLHRKGSRR